MDVIIHKLTDVILEADQNDSQSLELVQRFQVSGSFCISSKRMNLVQQIQSDYCAVCRGLMKKAVWHAAALLLIAQQK